MPIFDFTCLKCNSTVELLVKASDCPTCAICSEKLLKKLSAPSMLCFDEYSNRSSNGQCHVTKKMK
jgi:putative FmdB family regulatory protein